MSGKSDDAPRFEFRLDNTRLISGLVIAGTLFVLGLGIFPVGIFVDFPEPVLNKRIVTILFGAIWISLAAALFVGNWRNLGQRVFVYADGFVLEKTGSQVECKWDDIAAIWVDSATYGSVAMAKTNLTIQTTDGRKVLLSEFFLRMEVLVDVVLSETAKRMLPAILAAIEDGQTIKFGTLRVNSAGLVEGENDLLWSQAKPIEVLRGHIYVRRKDDDRTWYFARVKDMPNYHVFLAVAAEFLRKYDSDEPDQGKP